MAFAGHDLKGDIVAVARLVKDARRTSAAFALIIRTRLQRRGLGTLMHKLTQDYAVRIGICELGGMVDADDRKALNLIRQVNYKPGLQAGLFFVRVSKSLT